MALTMGKLFMFDLATVDALWRVVTFLAFGVALLVLGYAFPVLWSARRVPRRPNRKTGTRGRYGFPRTPVAVPGLPESARVRRIRLAQWRSAATTALHGFRGRARP